MPNLGNRTVGQNPSAANVRDPQQKGDEFRRSRGQDVHGKMVERTDQASATDRLKGADAGEDAGAGEAAD